jgi:pimeloyl-ACP methyl ester carboxylesterase
MVVRADYAGSGQTTDDGAPLTIDVLAAQVVAAVQAAGAVPFDNVGFSLGAMVATKIAAEHPDKVRSVVLLAGFASGADPRLKLQFQLWRRLIDRDRDALARTLLLTGFSPDFRAWLGDVAIEAAIRDIVTGSNWPGMARQVDLDLVADVRAEARRIAKPTLVIGCTRDHIIPCFCLESGYIPRHLTRKHGSKGRPVASGPEGRVFLHDVLFAHTFPEEPTGEYHHGASRIFYASAA